MIPRHLVIGVAAMLAIVLVMGLYLRHMSRAAAEMQRLASDTRPVAPPASGPTETVTLYVADDSSGTLRAQTAQIPLPGNRQQRAEELLRTLLRNYQRPDSPHPLAPAAELRSVYLIDPGAAVLDFNAAFADQHPSGILTEQLTVDSLVQTLGVNVPGITRVRILVEGDTRETLSGHADLTDFLDVGAVGQSISQSQ
jgi:spore germination protein GerM